MRCLTRRVNRRYRGGAVDEDENSRMIVREVAHRGSVRVERLVRPLVDTEFVINMANNFALLPIEILKGCPKDLTCRIIKLS